LGIEFGSNQWSEIDMMIEEVVSKFAHTRISKDHLA
jgi:hypothetical protein